MLPTMAKRFGRYETLRPIASGGMATVYLGRAVGVGGFERLVAVKVMHEHIAQEPAFVAMFLDEARMAARIHHPNVVATIDVQQGVEGLFLVMEYVQGPSLLAIGRKLGAEDRKLPLPITLRVFVDLLAGLHAAHELKGRDGEMLDLVHRDISPANVLVGVDGISRITDFGIARARTRIATTQDGLVKGKLAYMSREQVLAEPLDRRTDVYAAGVVLWETLTGKPLFHAEQEAAVLRAVLDGAPHGPREICSDIPEAIDRVCMTALAPEPGDRYDSALALAEALEQAARQEHIEIASPRSVAAFVDELAAHDVVESTELTTAADTSAPGPVSSVDVPPPVGGAEDRGSLPSAVDGSSQTGVAATLSLGAERSRQGPKTMAAFAAGLVSAIVLVVVGYLVLAGPSSPSLDGAADGSSSAAAAAASGEPDGMETSTASSSNGGAAASASSTASADTAAKPPPRRWPAPAKTYNPRQL